MDVEDGITINKAYAAKYEAKKRAEELSKLQDKYGDVASESSSSEEEDEDAEMLTADVEKDFLRTLSLIRSRDPRIYDNKTQFFRKDENEEQRKRKEEKKEEPMFLKDYERKQLLERGVMAGVSDSEEDKEDIKKMPATYQEEQEQVKAEFNQAAGEGEGEEEEGESMLTLRKKCKKEIEEEERDYVQWLKGERERMEGGEEEDFSGLRSLWSAPDLESGEAFLRDYILNRQFVDRDALMSQVPSYDEIVGGDSEEEGEEEKVGVSDDEDALDRQEEFEREYNFRFEEPGGDQITSYPRTVLGSVRREDDRRKEKRKERGGRREREKEQKQEELKRLKRLKRKEIREKLDRIKRITGNPNVGFSDADLEGDFDPASYDQAMARAFDDEYYVMEEEGGGEEGEGEGKPVFSDDEDGEMYGDWDQWDPQHCEDPDFNMDADFDPKTVAPPTKKSKLRKHRHKLAQAVSSKKPLFDPEEKTFEEYFDEYYSLDYEDVIGDMPCRFKYNQVPANSFGLTVEETLACEDKELNQWVSLKKAVQIRTEEEEERDKRRYKKQARNFKKKYQILASLKEPQEEQEQGKGKKPRKRKASKSIDREEAEQEGADIDEEEEWVAEREEKDGKGFGSVASGDGKSEPKKKKRKIKDALVNGSTTETDSTAKTGKKQKKKKKKPKVPATKLSTARLKSYGL